ncbi:MAG: aminotransferase class I/II-fold pyridoxal phosphate-dependent enzyme [Mailhella sp.]|nr:aminotransferase class I/II-fold pyridoxal phosphate-dependent enzyme [Mailhella sp.]
MKYPCIPCSNPAVDNPADHHSIHLQDIPMIRWNNDYNHGAHPAILAALQNTNENSYGGYGLDEWCERARQMILSHLGGADAEVHFLLGGTQANFTVINAALRPYQGVICADSGHIHVHETGAIEHGGHKIHVLKGENGKLSAAAIAAEAEAFRISGVQEHITQPKLVYISFPTEFGTIYSKQELEDIAAVCREYRLYLFVDGARMGYGLGAEGCDVTLADLARLADAFYIGGTKCGALMGEAVVLVNDDLKDHFRSYIKQNGGMLAKGWLLGLQFATLFENDLYFDITRQAVKDAMRIRNAFLEKGIPLFMESPTNQ